LLELEVLTIDALGIQRRYELDDIGYVVHQLHPGALIGRKDYAERMGSLSHTYHRFEVNGIIGLAPESRESAILA
jgi:hypothetical protein